MGERKEREKEEEREGRRERKLFKQLQFAGTTIYLCRYKLASLLTDTTFVDPTPDNCGSTSTHLHILTHVPIRD